MGEAWTFKEIIAETEKAILLKFGNKIGNDSAWFPKRSVELNRERKTVKVPDWLVEKVEFIKTN